MNLYTHYCAGCDEQHQLTQEEHDLVEASDDPFYCDACFKDPVRFEPADEVQCQCRVSYGMIRSTRGAGFFSDSEPGVINDASECPLHG